MVGVCVVLKASGDTIDDIRVGLTNMGSVPLRATAVEEALTGQSASTANIVAAAAKAADGTNPPTDLNASVEYKRHLATVLTKRAIIEAFANAG